MPRPAKPFGRRVPLPGNLAPVLPRVSFPLGRLALRLFPWIGLGLLLWDLYQLYNSYQFPSQYKCRDGSNRRQGYLYIPGEGSCGSFTDEIYHQNRTWSVGNPTLALVQAFDPPESFYTFWQVLEYQYFPALNSPGNPGVAPEPGGEPVIIPPPVSPVPIIPWIPIAVPVYAPQPLPIPRPRWVPVLPNPEAAPGPDPWNPEAPMPEEEPHRPGTIRPGFPSGNTAPGAGRPSPYPPPRPIPGPNALPQPFPARKPGRNVKERKMKASAGTRRLLGWAASAYSEASDILDAIHDALPKKYQGKDHPKAKFEAIYRHADKIDMNKAFENIWRNQVEDRYFGQKFGEMQDALSELGLDFPMPRDIGGVFGNTR